MRANFYILLLLLVTLCSCSTIRYKSKGDIPVKVSRATDHTKMFKADGKAPFYLWGTLPGEQVVHLDKLAIEQGFSEISKLVITEYTSFFDLFMSVVSLGFYMPRSYEIQGLGKTI
ncbi:MAG: hypothetical protein HOE90_14125 [Bacteriovoracaceae bacterium]|jgi:hypothetical protein|nr:hypothetical protein [Bacteriovoracaceae bacterium]